MEETKVALPNGGERDQYALNRRLGGFQNRSGRFLKRTNFLVPV